MSDKINGDQDKNIDQKEESKKSDNQDAKKIIDSKNNNNKPHKNLEKENQKDIKSHEIKNNINKQMDNKNTVKQEVKKTKKSNSLIVSLALILGVAGSAIAVYSLYNQNLENKKLQQSLSENKNQVALLVSSSSKSNDEISIAEKQVQTKLQGLENQLQVLTKKNYALSEQLKQVKSDYLLPQADLYKQLMLVEINTAHTYLTIASNYLKLYADGTQAIGLIKAAEQSLLNADQRAKPALLMVRKARFAVENAASLNNYQEDMTSLSELINLSEQLKLKLPGVNQTKPEAPRTNRWYSPLATSWEKITSLVKVQPLDPKNKILLNTNSRFELAVSLKLQLEQAKWALQRRDEVTFNQSMAQVINQVKSYYQDNINTQKWLEIAKSIRFDQGLNYQKSLNDAIWSVTQLENQVLKSDDKMTENDENTTQGASS